MVACFAFPFDFAVAAAEADCTVVAVVVVAAVVDSSYFAAVVADLMSFLSFITHHDVKSLKWLFLTHSCCCGLFGRNCIWFCPFWGC